MKGQSLFEVVVAIGIAALIIVGVVSLASTSIRNSSFSRNKTLASRFSQEAIEWLRAERDSGWSDFKDNVIGCGAVCCLDTIGWDSGSCSGVTIPDTPFIREVSFVCFKDDGVTKILCTDTEVDTIQSDVNTSWNDNQGTHDAKAATQFTNWRAQ